MGADRTWLLRFEDFKVTNGPDIHVVLSPNGGPDEKGAQCRKAYLEKMQTLDYQLGIVCSAARRILGFQKLARRSISPRKVGWKRQNVKTATNKSGCGALNGL